MANHCCTSSLFCRLCAFADVTGTSKQITCHPHLLHGHRHVRCSGRDHGSQWKGYKFLLSISWTISSSSLMLTVWSVGILSSLSTVCAVYTVLHANAHDVTNTEPAKLNIAQLMLTGTACHLTQRVTWQEAGTVDPVGNGCAGLLRKVGRGTQAHFPRFWHIWVRIVQTTVQTGAFWCFAAIRCVFNHEVHSRH